MKTLKLGIITREDAYNKAIEFGAQELLAACIAVEIELPRNVCYIRGDETPLAALIIEMADWSQSCLGYDFWQLMYESLSIFDDSLMKLTDVNEASTL